MKHGKYYKMNFSSSKALKKYLILLFSKLNKEQSWAMNLYPLISYIYSNIETFCYPL